MSSTPRASDLPVNDRKRPFAESQSDKPRCTPAQRRRAQKHHSASVAKTTAILAETKAVTIEKRNIELTQETRFLASQLSSSQSDNDKLRRANNQLTEQLASLRQKFANSREENAQPKAHLETFNIVNNSAQQLSTSRKPLTLPYNGAKSRV